jgi:hypothetical protein
LANQSLETAIRISEINIDERDINKLFTQIGIEISKLITIFEPEAEHLLLIATKTKATDIKQSEVKVRSAEKTDGFILNGSEAPKLDGLIAIKKPKVINGQAIQIFIPNHVEFMQTNGGFILNKKMEFETSGNNSLIDMMFDTNGENLIYKYTDRHSEIQGVYNIQIPIPEKKDLERISYYEFSKNTKNVYLIGCIFNDKVKGIISVDSTSENKWSDFIIQQLILIGNMVAIAIKNHE